jgi:hypothetical protein
VFAPKVTKPQAQAAHNPRSSRAPQQSTLPGSRFGYDPVERALFLQRTILNQAMLRLFARQKSRPAATNLPSDYEQEGAATENTMTRETSRGASWDFSKIPVFPPDRASQSRQAGIIQPKLVVGQVKDPLEHEADRVADQVMQMPDPRLSIATAHPQVSRKCTACQKDEEAQTLQPKSVGESKISAREAPPIVHEVLSSAGQPLDPGTRAFFEPRFGNDFSDVRVHTDTKAGESARVANALAYAMGQHIVFGAGQYLPEAPGGRRLIAHELTHTLQQRQQTIVPHLQRQDDGGLPPGGAPTSDSSVAAPDMTAQQATDAAQTVEDGGATDPKKQCAACLKACAKGGAALLAFCRTLPDPRLRAACYALDFVGVVACEGWCYWHFCD